MDRDVEHLKILSICHYVFAGFLGLFSFAPLIYACMGLVLVFFPTPQNLRPGEPPPAVFGYVLIVFGLFAAVLLWGMAACLVAAGRCLHAGRNRVFCFVVAAICCTTFPMGTLLGVFTLIVLSRPSVAAYFARGGKQDSLPVEGTAVERRDEFDEPDGLEHGPPMRASDASRMTLEERDEEHLKILSVCHYIFAGALGLFSLIAILYFGGMGLVFLNAPAPAGSAPAMFSSVLGVVGSIYLVIGCIVVLVMWALASCLFAAGRFLRGGRNRVFCMIVAGFGCVFGGPLGAALGVFTLIVLSRPSVVELFAPSRARDVLPAD